MQPKMECCMVFNRHEVAHAQNDCGLGFVNNISFVLIHSLMCNDATGHLCCP